jgi:hypothetical protein
MENKRTVVIKFEDTIALLKEYAEMVAGDTEKVAEINRSIEDMEDRKDKAIKKNSGEKKATTASVENPKIAEELYEVMEDGVKYTATEISNLGVEKISSASKATTILKILVADGRVANEKVKGVSKYFRT